MDVARTLFDQLKKKTQTVRDELSLSATTPHPIDSEKKASGDIPLVQGGTSVFGAAVVGLDTVQRFFVRSVDVAKSMKPFQGHDPARPAKSATGVAVIAESLDKAWVAHSKGNDAEASYDLSVAGSVSLGMVANREMVAEIVARVPVARDISSGFKTFMNAKLLNPEIRAACGLVKPVPLAGAAINGIMGGLAAGARALDGDYKGAGGEAVVTLANVAVYGAGIVMGAALLTAGAPAVAVGAAAVGAYVASEAASEVAARTYNHFAGTNVRGSGLMAVGRYAAHRIPEVADYVTKHPVEMLKHTAHVIGTLPGPLALAATVAEAAAGAIGSWFGAGKSTAASAHKADMQHAHMADWKTQKYHLNGVESELSATQVRDYLNAHQKESGIQVDADGKNGISREEFAKAVAAWNNGRGVHAQSVAHAPASAGHSPAGKPGKLHVQHG